MKWAPDMFDQQVTFLTVDNLEASIEFYRETLGLPLVLDQGTCKIFQTCPNGFVGIMLTSDFMGVSKEGVILTLVSEDVDGWYTRLKARGVPFDKTPQENPKFNIYHCFLRDPDGHLLEIQQFHDPAWPKPV